MIMSFCHEPELGNLFVKRTADSYTLFIHLFIDLLVYLFILLTV